MPTPEQAQIACDLALAGRSQLEIAEFLGVHPSLIGKWKLAHPVFRDSLRRAQEEGTIARHDAVKRRIELDPNTHRTRVLADWEKFGMERIYRHLWGPTLDVTQTTVDISGALLEARKRTLLPNSNPALPTNTQVIEYTEYSDVRPTDNESAVLPDGMPDPFS